MRKATLPVLILTSTFTLLACSSDDPAMMEPEEPVGTLTSGTARVTIGGQTWTSTSTQCVNIAGALAFSGQADNDPSISIFLVANPADPFANHPQVDVAINTDWRAGQDWTNIGATVPVTTAQGGYGTGQATFVNVLDTNGATGSYATAAGDYEFNCG